MSSQKILIVGPAWVGDMVMAQSLFKLLKHRDAQCILDVLAPAWTFPLLSCMPEVSQGIEMPISHGEFNLLKRKQIASKLKLTAYDQAIVLPNSWKAALIPWLARIPKRTGWRGEYRYLLLNDLRHLDKKRYPLMIEQYMALGLEAGEGLLTPYPLPAFRVPSAEDVLNKHQIRQSGRAILALAPGAEFGPSKRWPGAYFARVANQKLAEGWDVWLFGSPKDRHITREIMYLTDNRCEHIAGRTALNETIALISLVTGLVTNDSGLMHIASALQKPIVAIYGSTSPAFTPPLSPLGEVLKLELPCQPCFQRFCPLKHHRCMQDLSPTRVLEAISRWGMM